MDEVRIKQKRSQCLKILTGYPHATDPKERGLGIPNTWEILNPFIEHHAGKLLYKLTVEELEAFRRKLLSMRDTGWYYGKKEKDPDKPAEPGFFPPLIVLSGEHTIVN